MKTTPVKQVSFRPDTETSIALDFLLSHGLQERLEEMALGHILPYTSSIKALLSHLIEQEYRRVADLTELRNNVYDMAKALNKDSWLKEVPLEYHDVPKDQQPDWVRKQWVSWAEQHYNHKYDSITDYPDQPEQRPDFVPPEHVSNIGIRSLQELIRDGVLTIEQLPEFEGVNKCVIKHNVSNGDIVQIAYTNLGVFERITRQAFFDQNSPENEGAPESYFKFWRKSDIQLPKAEPMPDISDARVLQTLKTDDGYSFEMVAHEGDIFTRKTKLNDQGEPAGQPVIERLKKDGEGNTAVKVPDNLTKESHDKLGSAISEQRFLTILERTLGGVETMIERRYRAAQRPVPDFTPYREKIIAKVKNKELQMDRKVHPESPRAWGRPMRQFYAEIDIPVIIGLTAHLGKHELSPSLAKIPPIRDEAIEHIINDQNNPHAQAFFKLAEKHDKQGAVGKPLTDYIEALQLPDAGGALQRGTKRPKDREMLLKFCREDKVPTRTCFLAVLAFMAHRVDHAKAAWALIDSIEPVLNRIRQNADMTREDCYDALWRLRAVDNLPGLRPSTYCSLIYFLRPKQDGYMLSKHTAKSVNLIACQEVIEINKVGYPVDDNDKIKYEAYCRVIDALSRKMNMPGGDVEERLQSEDEPLGYWREYIERFK